MHTQTLVKCVSVCVWKRDWSTWRTDGLGYRSSTHIHSNTHPHTQTHSCKLSKNRVTSLFSECVFGGQFQQSNTLSFCNVGQLACISFSLHFSHVLSCTSYHSLKSCFGFTLLCLLIITFPTLHAGRQNWEKKQRKLSIFPSTFGWDQYRASRRVNIGHICARWLEAHHQVNANVAPCLLDGQKALVC